MTDFLDRAFRKPAPFRLLGPGMTVDERLTSGSGNQWHPTH